MAHALIVDDDPDVVDWLQEVARMEGFTVARAHSIRDARIELGRQRPDVLLTDLRLPDGEGIELVRELDKPEATEVIVVTGHATVDSAVAALRAGATDYLVKPADLDRVQAVLRHAKKTSALQHEIGELREELRKLGRFGRILGSSPRMQVLYDQLSRVAPTSATVMLIGESGPAKSWLPRRFTSCHVAGMLPSCPSTAVPSLPSSLKASCSVTSAAALRAPTGSTKASLSAPTAEPFSSMKSPRCPWSCK